jgi:hypothetical protein
MSANSLVCVTSDGWPSIYSSCRLVLRLMLSLDATLSVEVTSMWSWARAAAKWDQLASPRPAGLGFVPLGTTLLLDVPDALLVSVAVALVRGLIVRGRPTWSRHVSSLCFTDLMINACALSREANLRILPKSCMQVGPSIHGWSLSGHLIKPTSSAQLSIKVSVFPCLWINDMVIGSSARPSGLGEADRPGIFPFCLIFNTPIPAFTTHPKLVELY